MKKKILQIVTIIASIAVIACNNDAKVDSKTTSPAATANTKLDSLLVSGEIAGADIQRFDSLSKGIEGQQIRAFTISAEELFAAMGIESDKIIGEAKYKYIRAYLGYGKPFSEQNPSGFKLYIVPVKDADLSKNFAGYDLSFYKNGKVDTTIRKKGFTKKLTDDDGGYYMDLNAPCPYSCPENDGLILNLKKEKP